VNQLEKENIMIGISKPEKIHLDECKVDMEMLQTTLRHELAEDAEKSVGKFLIEMQISPCNECGHTRQANKKAPPKMVRLLR